MNSRSHCQKHLVKGILEPTDKWQRSLDVLGSKLPFFPYGDGLRPYSRGLYAVPIVRIPYERWDDRVLTLAHICPLRWVQAVEWKPGWSGAWNSRSLKTWRASWTNLIDWADAEGRPDPPRHSPSANSGFSVTFMIVGAQISKLQQKSRANWLGCSFFLPIVFETCSFGFLSMFYFN